MERTATPPLWENFGLLSAHHVDDTTLCCMSDEPPARKSTQPSRRWATHLGDLSILELLSILVPAFLAVLGASLVLFSCAFLLPVPNAPDPFEARVSSGPSPETKYVLVRGKVPAGTRTVGCEEQV